MLVTSIFSFSHNVFYSTEIIISDIHAIRPGLSGTVPDFDTLSQHPGNYKIVPEI